ncbi:triacylglycerol lipase OBL1 isoform X2 [Citrus sinensis]|uniref:triacylglycerol lipase OBL1 isoform X2 n=1 Tax=Citrus sinensis TaxID=2711 RepID=UPI0022799FCD|nr:triacylglycerol lipase OBL1 isoform X2 [Citrus sinensis]
MASTSNVDDFDSRYLIVNPENGGMVDLLKYLLLGDISSGVKFLEAEAVLVVEEAADHRWVIAVSIIARKIIGFLAKPMEYTGFVVDFTLNLLSQNGNIFGLLYSLLHGKVVIPQRGTETFLSTIGQLDGRIDLYKGQYLTEQLRYSDVGQSGIEMELVNRILMDLCIMASKLAYENAEVVRNVVVDHWKMHFVDFYNCWNGKMELTAYYAVKNKLKSLLEEHKKAKFVVTGHSLGGALAILFPTVLVLHDEMEIMHSLLGVYTFGQPRIGNERIGRFMKAHLESPVQKYFRVVYCNDMVPRLPYDDKTFSYKHFGVCLFYNSCYIEQKVDEEPNKNFFGLRYLIPVYLNALWELIRSLTMGYTHGPQYEEGWFSIFARILGLAFPGISAHCPTDYVNSVRLGKERTIQMSSF